MVAWVQILSTLAYKTEFSFSIKCLTLIIFLIQSCIGLGNTGSTPIYSISVNIFSRPQDESDRRIQETLLVGYECKESTRPPGGNI